MHAPTIGRERVEQMARVRTDRGWYPRRDSMDSGKRSLVLGLPLLLVVIACNKDVDTHTDEREQVERPPLASLFTGDKVTLPEPFAGLTFDMTRDEASRAVPSMTPDGDIIPPKYGGMWFNAHFDPDTHALLRVYFNMPEDQAVESMTQQWGAPQSAVEFRKQSLWWFNPEAELRVSLSDSLLTSDGETQVEFTRYWPIVEFLGEGPELGFQKHAPLLGSSAADVESKYAKWVRKDDGPLYLEYPPLEWGKYSTLVRLGWSNEGTVNRVSFQLEFGVHPEAKPEILALLERKWGAPKQEAEGSDTVYVFSETPFIRVKQETTRYTEGWTVVLEPTRP
jgi:hypothetical protein